MPTRNRRSLTVLAAQLCLAVGAAVGVSVVAASPAQAVTCTSSQVSNIDSGTDTVGGWASPALNMRNGPGTFCAILTTIPRHATVELWCYDTGQTISGITTWSYVTYQSYSGWVSDYYLSNHGSTQHCPGPWG